MSKDDYHLLESIGTGSFGSVSKIKRKSDDKILVWKEINFGKMSEKEKSQLVAEVNIIRELRNPFIVKYYDRIIDKSTTRLYIIMEYCAGGDLGHLISKAKKEKTYLDELLIWKVFAQAVIALKECHRRVDGNGVPRPVLHRDIKPANILLDADQNIKIGDFGLAKELSNHTKFAQTNVGTPLYMAPEIINEKNYDEKTDIWSLGCLLYELAALRPPFEASNVVSLGIKINTGKYNRIPSRYSDNLFECMRLMLQNEPRKRPKIEELEEMSSIQPALYKAKFLVQENHMQQTYAAKHRELVSKESALKAREDKMNEREHQLNEKEKKLVAFQQQLLLQQQKQQQNNHHHNNHSHQVIQKDLFNVKSREKHEDSIQPAIHYMCSDDSSSSSSSTAAASTVETIQSSAPSVVGPTTATATGSGDRGFQIYCDNQEIPNAITNMNNAAESSKRAKDLIAARPFALGSNANANTNVPNSTQVPTAPSTANLRPVPGIPNTKENIPAYGGGGMFQAPMFMRKNPTSNRGILAERNIDSNTGGAGAGGQEVGESPLKKQRYMPPSKPGGLGNNNNNNAPIQIDLFAILKQNNANNNNITANARNNNAPAPPPPSSFFEVNNRGLMKNMQPPQSYR